MKSSPIKETISFEDFEKHDIRVGTITSVSDVAKSNKLMKLTVDFGDHTRSILAGIKQERANPQEIEGKQALFVLNLPEKKMAGEISEKMTYVELNTEPSYMNEYTGALFLPHTDLSLFPSVKQILRPR